MNRNKSTLLAALSLSAALVQANDKPAKVRKDDIPRNEKQMWARIDEMQDEVQGHLLSGDRRFLDQLELARKKVADIMLTAESDKKDKQAVTELRQRSWTFWTRTVSEVEIEDVKEYNLNTALGQSAQPRASQAVPVQSQITYFNEGRVLTSQLATPEAQTPVSQDTSSRQYSSASQISGFPSVNIYNNNGNGGQQDANPESPQIETSNDRRPTELEYHTAQQPIQNNCPPEVPFCQPPQSLQASGYVTVGFHRARPAGARVQKKASNITPGNNRGTAQRPAAPSVASRGGGGGGHK